jgi:hypothetical protein
VLPGPFVFLERKAVEQFPAYPEQREPYLSRNDPPYLENAENQGIDQIVLYFF